MKQTIYERVLNRIVDRTQRIQGKMGVEFKNAKPFDKDVKSDRERLLEYETMPEAQKMMLRQYFPEQYTLLDAEMSRIKARYQRG